MGRPRSGGGTGSGSGSGNQKHPDRTGPPQFLLVVLTNEICCIIWPLLPRFLSVQQLTANGLISVNSQQRWDRVIVAAAAASYRIVFSFLFAWIACMSSPWISRKLFPDWRSWDTERDIRYNHWYEMLPLGRKMWREISARDNSAVRRGRLGEIVAFINLRDSAS